jgi:hypothetical protein
MATLTSSRNVSNLTKAYDLDELYANENCRVWIKLPTTLTDINDQPVTQPLHALLIEDVTFGANNTWGSPFEDLTSNQNVLGKGADVLQRSAAQMGWNAKINQGQVTPKPFISTISSWQPGGKPMFTFPLLFINYRANAPTGVGGDVRVPISYLFRGIYPGVGPMGLMMAPYGYEPSLTSFTNTITIRVGRWLEIPNLLLTQVEAVFSKEVTSDDTPLWGRCNIILEPAIMPSEKDVKSWFR